MLQPGAHLVQTGLLFLHYFGAGATVFKKTKLSLNLFLFSALQVFFAARWSSGGLYTTTAEYALCPAQSGLWQQVYLRCL